MPTGWASWAREPAGLSRGPGRTCRVLDGACRSSAEEGDGPCWLRGPSRVWPPGSAGCSPGSQARRRTSPFRQRPEASSSSRSGPPTPSAGELTRLQLSVGGFLPGSGPAPSRPTWPQKAAWPGEASGVPSAHPQAALCRAPPPRRTLVSLFIAFSPQALIPVCCLGVCSHKRWAQR